MRMVQFIGWVARMALGAIVGWLTLYSGVYPAVREALDGHSTETCRPDGSRTEPRPPDRVSQLP